MTRPSPLNNATHVCNVHLLQVLCWARQSYLLYFLWAGDHLQALSTSADEYPSLQDHRFLESGFMADQ